MPQDLLLSGLELDDVGALRGSGERVMRSLTRCDYYLQGGIHPNDTGLKNKKNTEASRSFFFFSFLPFATSKVHNYCHTWIFFI